jgi:hypothetical protein
VTRMDGESKWIGMVLLLDRVRLMEYSAVV